MVVWNRPEVTLCISQGVKFQLLSNQLAKQNVIITIVIIIIYPLTARVVLSTTNDLATSFCHFSLFSTALWHLANSRPVHSLMLSSHRFLCLPCLLPKVEQNVIGGGKTPSFSSTF